MAAASVLPHPLGDSTVVVPLNNETVREDAMASMVHAAVSRGWLSACIPMAPQICTHNEVPTDCPYGMAGRREALPKLLPPFHFQEWRQVGAEAYAPFVARIVAASAAPPTHDALFWRGAGTNAFREEVVAWGAGKPGLDLKLISMQDWGIEFVSLPQHARYTALLDVAGGGSSGRLVFLLATGRPVIVVDRAVEAWFYWDGTLTPWKHYIPAPATPAGVAEAWAWVRAHPAEARAIGSAGQAFVVTQLTPAHVHCRVAEVLCPSTQCRKELQQGVGAGWGGDALCPASQACSSAPWLVSVALLVALLVRWWRGGKAVAGSHVH